ncbi:small ribosomal subunit protein uS14-like [Myotis daubentonii]|uniref:small ribosomal subunit protein uS14-like n=1 Tax=Myotis daubentonii TaxID=98922 RepID=UPI0028734BEE|nr:small ribosomal subunit protein uS14-like [Myotis daubentonii]
MGHQKLDWSHPRKSGQGSRSCSVCSNQLGLVWKYGLNMWHRCFRRDPKDTGFLRLD